MTIPEWPQSDERELQMLREVLASSQWGGFHPFVQEFEERFAAFQSAKYAISAVNGSLTLELALQLAGVAAGDEVIVPAISFISTATSVSRIGAIPVFVDIDEQSFNIDPVQVRKAVTPLTKAVVAVHFSGVICDISSLQTICDETGIMLLEDAAHAHGSELRGQRAGSFGRVASFSFQNGKVLTSGEGGAVTTSDEELAQRARSISNCGRQVGRSFYEHHLVGTNLRISAFQAAVLICQLERLPAQIIQRAYGAELLKRNLSEVKEIVWQKHLEQQTQTSGYLLTGRLTGGIDHHAFCTALSAHGIPCAPFYPHTLFENPVFKHTACRVTPCPVAKDRVKDSFWIGHRLLLAGESTVVECAELMRSSISNLSLAQVG